MILERFPHRKINAFLHINIYKDSNQKTFSRFKTENMGFDWKEKPKFPVRVQRVHCVQYGDSPNLTVSKQCSVQNNIFYTAHVLSQNIDILDRGKGLYIYIYIYSIYIYISPKDLLGIFEEVYRNALISILKHLMGLIYSLL